MHNNDIARVALFWHKHAITKYPSCEPSCLLPNEYSEMAFLKVLLQVT